MRAAARLLPIVALAGCLVSAPALAEPMESIYRKCIYPDLNRMDAVVGSCTKVIKSGEGGSGAQSAAHLSRGNMYRRKGQYDRALADYDEALRLDPKDRAPTLTSRGNAWRGKKDYDRAIADHSEAIRLNPDYATAYSNRGNVWSDKAEWEKAIADYDKAIEVNPKYATAFYNRGLAWQARNERERALADFRAALALQPDFEEAADMLKKMDAAKK